MMSKLSIFLQILKNAIEKPQLLQELSEERSEIKDDKKFKMHEYSYGFDSVDDFFRSRFPDIRMKDFEIVIKFKTTDSCTNSSANSCDTAFSTTSTTNTCEQFYTQSCYSVPGPAHRVPRGLGEVPRPPRRRAGTDFEGCLSRDRRDNVSCKL